MLCEIVFALYSSYYEITSTKNVTIAPTTTSMDKNIQSVPNELE